MNLGTPPFLVVLALWFVLVLVFVTGLGIVKYLKDRRKQNHW